MMHIVLICLLTIAHLKQAVYFRVIKTMLKIIDIEGK